MNWLCQVCSDPCAAGDVICGRCAVVVERFWGKVTKYPDCWIYGGPISDTGYGTVAIGGRTLLAHRLSYLLAHGDFPASGMYSDHLCRVRACVNPAHLDVVTASTNFTRGIHQNALSHRANMCKRGHPFTPENTYVRRINGTRNCKTCARENTRLSRARRKIQRGYR